MARKRDVTQGERFRRLSNGGVWEVISLRQDVLGAIHAQMKLVDDPYTLKTLSTVALLDSSQFEPLGHDLLAG